MTIRNGIVSADQPTDSDLTSALAKSLLGSLRSKALVTEPEPPPPEQQSFASFATRVDELVSSSPELRSAVEEMMYRSARQTLVFGNGAVPSTAEFVDALHGPSIQRKGGTFVRWDWWGFQVRVSHEDLSNFLATAVPLAVITATLTAALAP